MNNQKWTAVLIFASVFLMVCTYGSSLMVQEEETSRDNVAHACDLCSEGDAHTYICDSCREGSEAWFSNPDQFADADAE